MSDEHTDPTRRPTQDDDDPLDRILAEEDEDVERGWEQTGVDEGEAPSG